MKTMLFTATAFALTLLAPAKSFATVEDISAYDIKVQIGSHIEEGTQLHYYRTPQGMVLAIATNFDNYLVMKFARTVPGYELAIDSRNRITSQITLIVPDSAKMDNHVITLNDKEVCAVSVNSRFNGVINSFCQ